MLAKRYYMAMSLCRRNVVQGEASWRRPLKPLVAYRCYALVLRPARCLSAVRWVGRRGAVGERERHLLSWRQLATDASVSGTFSMRSFSTPQVVCTRRRTAIGSE